MRTVAFCEIEPYCQAVLRKHWPEVPIFGDVRDLHAFDVGPVDVIAGGFPCQDISTAGKGAGLRGERSGLWSEYRRLIEECSPAWAIIENVSALRSRGLEEVLGELAALGFDAEWHCIPASAIGAPHRRDRIWIVANGCRQRGAARREPQDLVSASGTPEGNCEQRQWRWPAPDDRRADMAYAPLASFWTGLCEPDEAQQRDQPSDGGCVVADTDSERGCSRDDEREDAADARQPSRHPRSRSWDVEPDVGRVANGVPSRVDRLRCLGNAIVPQIAEIIGQAIVSFDANPPAIGGSDQ